MLRSALDLGVRGLGSAPYGLGPSIATVLGRAGYGLYWSERRLALWNLEHCFPQRSTAWRRRVALRFFEHVVKSAYEVFHAAERPNDVDALLAVENRWRLDEAIAQGQGVVAVTGHYGNFALLPFFLRTATPRTAYIARASKRKVGPLVAASRQYYRESLKPRAGALVLSSDLRGALGAARLLREGNSVVVFSDLVWGSGVAPVTLLGVPHEVSRAPAALALKTGAALLPIFMERTPTGTQRMVVGRAINAPRAACSRRAAEQAMMEEFTALLEGFIRAHPEQWYWLHRSWRTAQGPGLW
jgi:KDO2-lipid IV(A) lauroyltransferase